MIWAILIFLVFISLFLLRKDFKYTFITYNIFLCILFYIYITIFSKYDIENLAWYEKWAIWMMMFPYIALWLWIMFFGFTKDSFQLYKNNKAKKKLPQ